MNESIYRANQCIEHLTKFIKKIIFIVSEFFFFLNGSTISQMLLINIYKLLQKFLKREGKLSKQLFMELIQKSKSIFRNYFVS